MNSWLNLKVILTSITTALALALALCGCSTPPQNQTNRLSPVDRSTGQLDRRVATAGGGDIPANVILKGVVTNNSSGISGECLILKGGLVTISSAGGDSRTKNIQATLNDTKRPDSRQGNSQQRTANMPNRKREDVQSSKTYSESELVELVNLARGGDLKNLHGEAEDDDKTYSSIELVAWVSEPGQAPIPHVIFIQNQKGVQKINSQLTEDQVARITSLTRSVCH